MLLNELSSWTKTFRKIALSHTHISVGTQSHYLECGVTSFFSTISGVAYRLKRLTINTNILWPVEVEKMQ